MKKDEISQYEKINKLMIDFVYPKIIELMKDIGVSDIIVKDIGSDYSPRKILQSGEIMIYSTAGLAIEFGGNTDGFYRLGQIIDTNLCPTFLRAKERNALHNYIKYAKRIFQKLKELEEQKNEIEIFMKEVIEYANNYGNTRKILTEKNN